MKVIFLDIDGVLNTYTTKFRVITNGQIRTGMFGMDPELTGRLSRIVSAADAHIVITSSWKSIGLDVVGENFAYAGFPQLRSRIVDRTHGYGDASVAAWMSEHPEVTAFVLIDDSRMYESTPERFVKRAGAAGLQEADADRAIAILNHAAHPAERQVGT